MFVEPRWRLVRRCDDNRAGGEQRFEQPPEDHCIGDVGDVQLVEAKKPCLLGNALRDVRDRIARYVRPGHRDVIVDVRHEFVEVGALFRFEGRFFEKEVHQHRLAAAHGAPDVKPLGEAGSLPNRRENTLRFWLSCINSRMKRIQTHSECRLRRIGINLALGKTFLIALDDRSHSPAGPHTSPIR